MDDSTPDQSTIFVGKPDSFLEYHFPFQNLVLVTDLLPKRSLIISLACLYSFIGFRNIFRKEIKAMIAYILIINPVAVASNTCKMSLR
jgi:hypothetical protein